MHIKSVGRCTCYSSHSTGVSHCPSCQGRATQKPTREYDIHISGASTVALFMTRVTSLRDFVESKNKASSRHLIYIMLSHSSASVIFWLQMWRRCKGRDYLRYEQIIAELFLSCNGIRLLGMKKARCAAGFY